MGLWDNELVDDVDSDKLENCRRGEIIDCNCLRSFLEVVH